MQSRRLPRRKFDPGAFNEAHGRIRRGQLLFQQRFAFERRERCVGNSGTTPFDSSARPGRTFSSAAQPFMKGACRARSACVRGGPSRSRTGASRGR